MAAWPSGIFISLNAGGILFHNLTTGFRVIFKSLLKGRPASGKLLGPLLSLGRLLFALLLGADRWSGSCRGGSRPVRSCGGRSGRWCGRTGLGRGSTTGGRLDRLIGCGRWRWIRQLWIAATRVGCNDPWVRSLAGGREIEEIHALWYSIGEAQGHGSLAAAVKEVSPG